MIKNCLQCKKEFTARYSISKYCNKQCYGNSLSFWKISTQEQKIIRMKQIYDLYVVKSDNCWDWKGGKTNWGYGNININKKTELVHRISWIIHNGEIPKGLLVCHSCDNPICSNPKHLWLGTNYENQHDCIKKGRKYLFKKK